MAEDFSESQLRPIGQVLEVDTDSGSVATEQNDTSSSTTSSTSSVLSYTYENGWRYHAYQEGGEYQLPTDKVIESAIILILSAKCPPNLQHHLWGLTLSGALHITPLLNPLKSALDIGTGTGIWALAFATEHPSTLVIGTDISPVKPNHTPPRNCTFLVSDVEKPWTFSTKFDFIHVRMLTFVVRNWAHLIRQCFENLNPGGCFEIQEFQFPIFCDDATAGPDSAVTRWGDRIVEAAAKIGIDITAAVGFKPLLEEAGFVNIRRELPKWPVGSWPKAKREKEIGRVALKNSLGALEGVSTGFLTRVLGWSQADVDKLLEEVRAEMMDEGMHHYCQLYVYCAHKPEEET